jgi:phosphoglycolate phosphatase-like HAD superfamily hydrolase
MLALYDIDGTLVRTGGAGARALRRACHALHGLPDAVAGMDFGGKTDPGIVEEIFTRHLGRAPTRAEFDTLMHEYVRHLADEVEKTPAYRVLDGVHAAIEATAARGAAVGLATGNVEAGARIKLERGDLWHRFAFGGFGGDAGAGGDRRALVERAIERGERHAGRAVPRRQVLVIGDTPRDLAAAHACGAVAVAVASGAASADALRAASADVVFETLAELPAWLARF